MRDIGESDMAEYLPAARTERDDALHVNGRCGQVDGIDSIGKTAEIRVSRFNTEVLEEFVANIGVK